MRSLGNFRQAVESPKSSNSMGYICLKTAFLHLKHYLQIERALKIEILIRSFNPNLKKYELKIHRGVICHDNEELHKI